MSTTSAYRNATATISSSPLPNAVTMSSGLSTGARVGIGVIPLILAVLIALAWVLWWRRKRPRGQDIVAGGPSGNGKDVTLSPKQVLGLDNASYLGRLPTRTGKFVVPGQLDDLWANETADLTVAPAYIGPSFELSGRPDNSVPNRANLAGAGVNPWDVELGPNPVIFPHLRGSPKAGPSAIPDGGEDAVGSHTSLPSAMQPKRALQHIKSVAETFKRLKRSKEMPEVPSSTVEIEMVDFSSWEGNTRSNASTATDSASQTLSPITTASTTSYPGKGKGPVVEPTDIHDVVNFAVGIPDYEIVDSLALEERGVKIAPVSPLAESVEAPSDLQLSCSKCDLVFRTPGLLK
jgi:hypothetical protein